jgi:hypothetical protein
MNTRSVLSTALVAMAVSFIAAPLPALPEAAARAPAVVPAPCVASATADVAPATPLVARQQEQEEGPGKGDDLARIRRWRSFLDRAHRAFFASHMDTAAVKAKITQADDRIAELEAAPADDPGGRSDITGDVGFLERAQRAFTFAHMNTADVDKWLEEAKEGG